MPGQGIWKPFSYFMPIRIHAGEGNCQHPLTCYTDHIDTPNMNNTSDNMLRIEFEQEEDGRWIAEILELPGVTAYGVTRQEAQEKVEALALRALADRLEHGETVPELGELFVAA